MTRRLALVTILADNVLGLIRFYCDALGLEVASASGDYVELQYKATSIDCLPICQEWPSLTGSRAPASVLVRPMPGLGVGVTR
jgi:hypothetical protein